MENPAADRLPEAHSLPDGFVDSSADPLASSTQMPEQEEPLTDYKEEKLVEIDSRPELVVDELQPSEVKADNSENSRTFPVQLSETDGFDASRELEVPGEGCSEKSECTSVMSESANSVSGNVVRESGELLSFGKLQDQEKYQSSEKAAEEGLETQAVFMKGISSTERAENNRKETSELKRKSTKRTFKSEKEFLEFTLRYQQVLAERDAAITVRDKLESLCRELQRQNKMLMKL